MYGKHIFSNLLTICFCCKHRQRLIPKEHKEELHKYITGLAQNRQAKMLAVHCMPDHAHLFVGFKPIILIPDFTKEITVESNEFINSKKWVKGKFSCRIKVAPTEPTGFNDLLQTGSSYGADLHLNAFVHFYLCVSRKIIVYHTVWTKINT